MLYKKIMARLASEEFKFLKASWLKPTITTKMCEAMLIKRQLKTSLLALLLLSFSVNTYADSSENLNIWTKAKDSLSATWESQSYELYVPVNTWHNRSYYSAEKIASYNEQPWGLGVGKYRIDADGDWHGLYVMAFLDSHNKMEPIVGYGYQKIWRPADDLRLGLGYTAGVTLREDSNYLLPIPVVAPLLSVGYKKIAVQSTYIIGGEGHGNILFTWLRWQM
jgi:palmitoyl transferase